MASHKLQAASPRALETSEALLKMKALYNAEWVCFLKEEGNISFCCMEIKLNLLTNGSGCYL